MWTSALPWLPSLTILLLFVLPLESTPVKGTRCFDCNYSPSGLTRVENGSWVDTTNGIFPKCALNSYSEDIDFINKWDCSSNTCLVRLDQNGLVFRGCADSWNLPRLVDVNVNCEHQGSSKSLWWFCQGDLCNDVDIETQCGDGGYDYIQKEPIYIPAETSPTPVPTTYPPATPPTTYPTPSYEPPLPPALPKQLDYGYPPYLNDYSLGVPGLPRPWTLRPGAETVHGKEFIDPSGFLLDFYTNRQKAIQQDYHRNGPIHTKSTYDNLPYATAAGVGVGAELPPSTPEEEVYFSRKTGELIYQDDVEATAEVGSDDSGAYTPATGIYKSDFSNHYYAPWNYYSPYYPWYAGHYKTAYTFPTGYIHSAGTKSEQPVSKSVHTRAVTLPPPAPTPSYLAESKFYQPSSTTHYGAPSKSYEPPNKSYEPPSKSYQPPSKSYEPPSKSYEPPSKSYEPPSKSYEPPSKSYQPPSKSFVPSSKSYKPPSKSYQPPSKSFEPPSKSYEPPSKSYQPPSKSYEPPSKSYQPPSKSYEPPSKVYIPPPTKSYEPPSKVYIQPTKSYEPPSKVYIPPPTKSYEPPAPFYEEYEYYEYEFPSTVYEPEPPSKSYEPPSKSYEPPSKSYEPPTKSYEPPSKSYEPPSKSYEAPSKSYEPPSKSYEPPSKSYEPPTKSHEPYIPPSLPPYKSFGHPVGSGPCTGDCFDNQSGLFPHPEGNDRFIQCGSGMLGGKSCDCCVPFTHLCPQGTSFDDVMKVCSRGTDATPYKENVYQPIEYLAVR